MCASAASAASRPASRGVTMSVTTHLINARGSEFAICLLICGFVQSFRQRNAG
jgi:hypothetical protein